VGLSEALVLRVEESVAPALGERVGVEVGDEEAQSSTLSLLLDVSAITRVLGLLGSTATPWGEASVASVANAESTKGDACPDPTTVAVPPVEAIMERTLFPPLSAT